MNSPTIIWKLLVISGIVTTYKYFLAETDFIYMLYVKCMIILFLPNGDANYTYVFSPIKCGLEPIP
jgi:hypothetical protein